MHMHIVYIHINCTLNRNIYACNVYAHLYTRTHVHRGKTQQRENEFFLGRIQRYCRLGVPRAHMRRQIIIGQTPRSFICLSRLPHRQYSSSRKDILFRFCFQTPCLSRCTLTRRKFSSSLLDGMTRKQADLHKFLLTSLRTAPIPKAIEVFKKFIVTNDAAPLSWNLILSVCAREPFVYNDLWQLYDKRKSALDLSATLAILFNAPRVVSALSNTSDDKAELERKKKELWGKYRDLYQTSLNKFNPEVRASFMNAAAHFEQYELCESMWNEVLELYPIPKLLNTQSSFTSSTSTPFSSAASPTPTPIGSIHAHETCNPSATLTAPIFPTAPNPSTITTTTATSTATTTTTSATTNGPTTSASPAVLATLPAKLSYRAALLTFIRTGKLDKFRQVIDHMAFWKCTLEAKTFRWYFYEAAKLREFEMVELMYACFEPQLEAHLGFFDQMIAQAGAANQFGMEEFQK